MSLDGARCELHVCSDTRRGAGGEGVDEGGEVGEVGGQAVQRPQQPGITRVQDVGALLRRAGPTAAAAPSATRTTVIQIGDEVLALTTPDSEGAVKAILIGG